MCSCSKIINEQAPSTGEFHGCPFKHSSQKSLEAKLYKDQISKGHVDEILRLADDKHYQLACTRYFEVTHPGIKDKIDPIEHPNQYYELSKKLADGDVKQDAMNIDG